MGSNQTHKTRFQDIVYFKLNKWSTKILQKISTKRLNLMFKTDNKTRNFIKLTSLPREKIPNRRRENWKCKHEFWLNSEAKLKPSSIELPFCTIKANSWEKNERETEAHVKILQRCERKIIKLSVKKEGKNKLIVYIEINRISTVLN